MMISWRSNDRNIKFITLKYQICVKYIIKIIKNNNILIFDSITHDETHLKK